MSTNVSHCSGEDGVEPGLFDDVVKIMAAIKEADAGDFATDSEMAVFRQRWAAYADERPR